MINTIKADILNGIDPNQKTLILHGCNCFHTMGAGIAKYLKQKYPQVYKADLSTLYGNKTKLGSYSTAIITPQLHILNCYLQFTYGRERKVYVEYFQVSKCLEKVSANYDPSWEIRMPKIGCGLAGGNWDIIQKIVEFHLGNRNVNVYFI